MIEINRMEVHMTMTKNFPTLETGRLVLREVNEQDKNDIFQYLSDEDVMKYYGLSPFTSVSEVVEEISWYKSIYDSEIGIRWGITERDCNKVIGSCGFHNWDKRHNRAEVGFELNKEYWNKGMMTEALRAVIQYGFSNLHINRIQALVEPENTSSLQVLKKVGFKEEGLLAQYEFTRGKYDDLIMLAILKKDFTQ